MDWSERGWNHVLVFSLSMLAKLKYWVHHLLEMQNPLLLLDCLSSLLVLCVLFSLRLCMSESLGVSLAHRFCLAPVRLQFEQCSWLWWDYSHQVLWHYATSWVYYQVDILSLFFLCYICDSIPHSRVCEVWEQFWKAWAVFLPIFRDFSNYLSLQTEYHLYPIYQAEYCLTPFLLPFEVC